MAKAGYASFVGRPNAGKSTLLNRIIGEKVAIVSDKPQTTRTRILAVKTYPEGQVAFLDTPGIHRPLHRLNVRMVDAAVDTFREVDVIALLFDASTKPGHGDEYVAKLLKDVRTPTILVLNKIDLVSKAKLLPLIEKAQHWHDFAAIVPVSATTGDGVDRLERVLLDQLPEGQPSFPDDYLTDQPERVLVAETVREKVLQHTRDELPFSTAVVVDEFDEEDRERLLRLFCTIFVETESQKPIVIGRGGSMIKRIGTEAREDIERFFQCKVFLDLRVKVNPQWRDNDRALDEIGLPRTKTATPVARRFSGAKGKPPASRGSFGRKPKSRKR
jgi:GTP-binding protein Era